MSAFVETALVAKGTLATIAMMAAQGTALALIALLALGIVRERVRPAFQAALWLVVLAKFVLPWGPALPWSLADLIAIVRGEGGGGAAISLAPHAVSGPAELPAVAPLVGWLLLVSGWATGVAIVLGRALIAQRHTLHAARRGVPAPASALALVRTLATQVRVRSPRLVVGDAATGPHVVGLVRSIIVVPPALLDDPTLLRAALLHELAHVRRRDAIGRLVQLAALAVFWWWPVVRLASRRLELARERACDAWALEAGDISRPAYARLLVQMAQLRMTAAPAFAAPHALDARVAAVLGPTARPRLGLVHRLALIAWAMLALGGARSAAARGSREVCEYTPARGYALFLAHPEADADGDGTLSRDEACLFQAEVRKRVVEPDQVSTMNDATQELLAEPLCCNCDPAEGRSGLSTTPWPSADASCQ